METSFLTGSKLSRVNIEQSKRLHGIDALRAIAMIFGMLLHATIAYKINALPNWPHDKYFNHWTFDFLYHFIHSFRMPLFFLIAGYFSRLLFHKLGEKAFIYHRFKRILIPFIFSIVFILPFTTLPFSIYRYSTFYPGQWDVILRYSLNELIHWNGMAHLWFLYYLLIFYSVTIVFFRTRRIFFHQWSSSRVTAFINFFHPSSFKGMALYILFIWSILLGSPKLYLDVDTGIIPGPSYLVFYGLFFLIGWLINKKSISFIWILKNFRLFLSLGSGLCILLFFVDFKNYPDGGWRFLLIKLPVATQILLLVYGTIGLFLRYCRTENTFWRYISDASYWMYLIHLGIVAGLQVYFMSTTIPGVIRFLLVLIIPIALTLVTYHYFVRYTIIGNYLHGKRKKIIDS